MQILLILLVKITSAHVLVSTAVATLSRWHTVTLGSEVHAEPRSHLLLSFSPRLLSSLYLIARFVEILRRVVCRTKRRPIEVIEHQIHILSLLVLQVISNLNVTVHLDLDVRVSLA